MVKRRTRRHTTATKLSKVYKRLLKVTPHKTKRRYKVVKRRKRKR